MKLRRHTRENEKNKDMLSDFPDCLLLHILSFLNAKEAVQTCILSTRWKHLWKGIPTLTLSYSHFTTHEGFTEFVKQILSLRDSLMVVNALDFKHCSSLNVEPSLLERIIRYAVSHNVNRLHLSCCLPRFSILPSLFSCQSLTSLELFPSYHLQRFPNSLNLPALTCLKLHGFSFYGLNNNTRVEPFSTFNVLNTLILCDCFVLGVLCISNTTLLNLSIPGYACYSKLELSAPNLCTFAFTYNIFNRVLFGSSLSSIKHVSIDVYEFKNSPENYPMEIALGLLKLIKMTDVKSLTICPITLQALSLVSDMKLKLPFLCNLKSLKLNLNLDSYSFSVMARRDIKLEQASGKSWKESVKLRETIKAGLEPKYASILDGVIGLLLQNSPSAKVDILLGS